MFHFLFELKKQIIFTIINNRALFPNKLNHHKFFYQGFFMRFLLFTFISFCLFSLSLLADEKFVYIKGQKLHYLEEGKKEKPLLLFLHGAPERAEVWRDYLEAFKTDYHVVAYTMRGTHPSSIPNKISAFHLDKLASDVIAVADALGGKGKPFYLVGHDWGASTAWQTIIKYPHRVIKLSVMSVPHPVIYSRGYYEDYRHQQLLDSYIYPIRQGLSPWTLQENLINNAKRFQDIVFTENNPSSYDPELRNLYVNSWTFKNGASIQSVFNLYKAMDTYPPMKNIPFFIRPFVCQLKRDLIVKKPVLFFYGDNDPYFSAEVMDKVKDYGCVRNMEKVLFKDADHWINHSHKKEIIGKLKLFFKKN